jgi:RimJ/RimL family protein N-acetyltransferase
MKLVDAYEHPIAVKILWELLEERTPEASISHKKMPTFERHEDFVLSRPYPYWYLIMADDVFVGAIYLTRDDEIGASIFERCRRRGYARAAIELLIKTHPRERYLANINPNNEPSIRLFGALGFTHLQNTYELRP